MDSTRPEIDIEKELSCSICTELLYQPLTLLDCLHTFCGACLKEWFTWQAAAAENAPTPPPADSSVFTCPSCRAPVRDARHNAGVATLLGMFLAANPGKSRAEGDMAEMNDKYRPGDSVLPRLNLPERTPEQVRLEAEERRLIEQVRQMSLQEAVADSSHHHHRSHSRSRAESSFRDRRTRHRRDASREPSRPGSGGERARRSTAEGETRRRLEQAAALRADSRSAEDGSSSRHSRRSGSRQRGSGEQTTDARRRHIEHQSSLRSLISSSDTGSLNIEREIEEFARQIQEEGLLDGLDLDNLDLDNNDELSQRITEAYRRRQRQRSRAEAVRRSSGSSESPRRSDSAAPERRSPPSRASSRPPSRQRAHSASSRSHSTSRRSDVQSSSRPPPSSSSNPTHLDVREPARRHRRRTTSGGRSATIPVSFAPAENRPAARSQTDLSLQQHDTPARRPGSSSSGGGESRSLGAPIATGGSARAASASPATRPLPFSVRVGSSGLGAVQALEPATGKNNASSRNRRARRPADLHVGSSAGSDLPEPVVLPGPDSPSPSLLSPSPLSPPPLSPSLLYPEPSITCNRCRKEHIEYELHYTCSVCHAGNWNICLSCYRRGKGCLHWFGFGYAAWSKWERARRDSDAGIAEPHVLTANRYLPPSPSDAGGGSTSMIPQGFAIRNPVERLQSGTFCSRCFAWANECFWRCGICNEGDWGFCRSCVNQGRCCPHPLLPLAYSAPHRAAELPPSEGPSQSNSPSLRPSSPSRTVSSVSPGSDVAGTGTFLPLAFTIRCDLCRAPIPPAHHRFHCYFCKSSADPDSQPGDYDLCQGCYAGLVADKAVSPENGPGGWRRCPQGHRMAVLCFLDSIDGQWRSLVHDCVGGQKLQFEPYESKNHGNTDSGNDNNHHTDDMEAAGPGLQLWYWYEGERRLERLVARDVRATAMAADAEVERRLTDRFPPADGGYGMRAVARWAWYPAAAGAEDELLFPRGAEIREIEDVNKEWFHGVFMGAKGLFPAPYVQVTK